MRADASMMGVPKYERVENDFYPTEAACTNALINHLISIDYLNAGDSVLEPACGDGAIVREFEKRGFGVVASDLHPQLEEARTLDFLEHAFEDEEWFVPEKTLIVTNPPYQVPWINLFIERCIHYAKLGCVTALLMRNEVDCAVRRRKYFEENPFYDRKLVLNWRPRWIPGSTGAPRHNYAWYVFSDMHTSRSPVIEYLNRP